MQNNKKTPIETWHFDQFDHFDRLSALTGRMFSVTNLKFGTWNFINLLTILFLFIQCSNNPKPKTINTKQKTENRKPATVLTPGQDTIKPPKTILTDTCPKPRTFQIPKKEGGSYLYTYSDGDTATIYFKPAKVKPLKVFTRLLATTDTTEQNAAAHGFFTTYTTDNGLALDAICSGFRDKTGNLWFGTYGGGVSRYDGKSFINFTTAQGLANNNVKSITEDKTGNLWFGTYGGGVSRYDGKSFTNFTTAQGLANNTVYSITEDKTGNL